jgi:GT2 family glycosyltransferase
MNDVAVVVLNHNGRSLLDTCLSSLRQTTIAADIVVADNGSTDGSLAHLRENYPAVRTLDLERNWGFAEGYNRALAQLSHPWLALLNNDAALAPDWLERLLTVAEREPRAAVLGGKLCFDHDWGGEARLQSAGARFTDAGTAFEIGWGERDRGQYDRGGRVGSIPGAAMLVRRSAFCALGGFDARYFAYLEDVDLCWRAWLMEFETLYVPEAIAWHRFGASAGGRASPFRIQWMQRNRLANMFKNLEWSSLPWGLVVSVAYDVYRVVEYSAHGRFGGLRALLAGTTIFLRDLRSILAQRVMIQRHRRVSDRALRQMGLLASAVAAMREYRRLGRLDIEGQSA